MNLTMPFSFLARTFTAVVLTWISGAGAFGAEEAKPYPLKTCVVSDEKLGSMGKTYVHKYEGREVHFCCKACVKDFNKDPKKFLKKLDDASPKTVAGEAK